VTSYEVRRFMMDFLTLWKSMCSFVSFPQLYHFDGEDGV
jgi:hypothetical protein